MYLKWIRIQFCSFCVNLSSQNSSSVSLSLLVLFILLGSHNRIHWSIDQVTGFVTETSSRQIRIRSLTRDDCRSMVFVKFARKNANLSILEASFEKPVLRLLWSLASIDCNSTVKFTRNRFVSPPRLGARSKNRVIDVVYSSMVRSRMFVIQFACVHCGD